MTTEQHAGLVRAIESAIEAADADATGTAQSVSADYVDLDSAGSTGLRGRCWQGSDALQSLDGDERTRGDLAEAARKRAALASQIAGHHFRLLSALKTAAEYARRTGDVHGFEDLDYQRTVVATFSRQVSSEADNAHAEWVSLLGRRRA
jgi:hypothetical protein